MVIVYLLIRINAVSGLPRSEKNFWKMKFFSRSGIFDLSEGMDNCKISGKSQGILRWMISGNPVFANSTFFHFCHFKY